MGAFFFVLTRPSPIVDERVEFDLFRTSLAQN